MEADPHAERVPELARGVASGLGSLQVGRTNWAIWITSVYLWLPFTLLPIYAALERVPGSFLEASSDLGARGWFTFRRVVFPLIVPGIVAGSIFSFSLTLGDYIVPELVGNTQFIGNVIYDNVGVAGNVPLAAAYALVPIAVMAVYLLLAKRAGRVRGALTMESRAARILIRAGTVFTLVFLYVPLGIVVIYAFNDAIGQAWPIQDYTLKWFAIAFREAAVREAHRSTRSRWRCSPRRSRCSSGARPRSPSIGSTSSGATRSRSSSSSRSRCRGS